MSKKEQRQNSKVLQSDLVKKVFVRYPGSSLMYIYVLDFCLSINLRNEYDKNLKILRVIELSGITTKIVILRRY